MPFVQMREQDDRAYSILAWNLKERKDVRKTMKKCLGIMMAALMVFAILPLAAFADEPKEPTPITGTITIDNAVKDQTYSIYKILDVSYNVQTETYSYKANSSWVKFLSTQSEVITTTSGDEVTNVEDNLKWVATSEAAAAKFAQDALAWAKDPAHPIDVLDGNSKIAQGTTVEFTGLEFGYYLVDSALGTVCSLGVTAPDVIIKEKNTEPTVEKEVKENSTGNYGKRNDANFNETVEFRSTIKIGKGASRIVYHDLMSDGLDFKNDENDVRVYLKQQGAEEETPVGKDNYTVVVPAEKDKHCFEEGACTFDVEFDKSFCESLAENNELIIYYSATLNENATVGVEGNPNTAQLTYGEKGEGKSEPSKTETYTWEINIFKYTGDLNAPKPLSGAKFVLLKDDNGKPGIACRMLV